MYDLSPPITENLAVWPGDTASSRELLMQLSNGDSVTLSTLHATVHLGSHADGQNHYAIDGDGVGEQPLEHYIGECRVIHVQAERGSRYGIDSIPEGTPIDAPRILLGTGTYPDPNQFNTDFAAPDPSLIDHLADHGVITIGVDTPSVDLCDSKDLPTHHQCYKRGLRILETLQLTQVPAGRYELIALPLKLMGFDGSPVRAILRPLSS
ncbi:MAG: cyclase family protein [Phycisphaerales bacterium]|nr:cyclase family protein [Phycisphaerales bacterium]